MHNEVFKILMASVGPVPPCVRTIAAQFGISSRTLQRKLKREGTSHHDLVEKMRQVRAIKHLEETSLSVGKISQLLGFADQSAFCRAFKRWTGSTPSRYRRLAVSSGPSGTQDPLLGAEEVGGRPSTEAPGSFGTQLAPTGSY